MNIEQFWSLIENIKNSQEPESDIKTELRKLSAEEIVSYQEHFDTLHEQAYSWKLWGAAYLIGGGCSDDGFMDFRYGLISKGKDIFEKAVSDPDSLAFLGEDAEIENESFGYSAHEIYEEMTGNDIPRKDFTQAEEPTGAEWDFDDEEENQKHLPKLSEIFE
ncbi:MAG: DUF4240 domain-containing protein [Opitutaceae bacterium]